jgi:H+-transporting ATPase
LEIMAFLISISVVLCATVLGFLLHTERTSFADAISFTVVLLVVSVPMAMEVVTTSTMAIGSRVLSRAGVIVARLSSIEELAGMNMLCSDKTGTLTLNKMVIQEEAPVFEEGLTQADLLRFAALATKWHEPPKDAVDTLVLGAVDVASLRDYEAIDYLPFDPAVKRTESTVRDTASGAVFKTTKGAPHIIAALVPDSPAAAQLHTHVEQFAERGIRCLAVARGAADGSDAWTLLGLLTFLDPPRPDTKVTLQRCMGNGVAVKMITGDHVAIAKETARQLGIGVNILNAERLPNLNAKGKAPKDLDKYVPQILGADGFAQVFPEHKFLIVEALRQAGYAVGMTGDGVNDAPALKRADIGIAVQGATDAARAAADIVLTQPGLAVVVDAIAIARGIFRRMQNFILYRVACTLQLLIFFFIAVIAFQPSDYALGLRGANGGENVALGVFGSHGRPGGALVMWHSDACAERSWNLAEIDRGLGPYSLGVTAAQLLAAPPGSEGYHLAHGAVVDAAADTVTGRVCVEQWPRTFIIPLIALIFITLLNDGTIISIAYDNVQPAMHPERWNLLLLYMISGFMGVIALASSIILLHLMLESHSPSSWWRHWGLPPVSYGTVTGALYLKVSLSDFFTLFSARTTRWFFSIRPAWMLLGAACVALSASTVLAAKWPRALNGKSLSERYLSEARFSDHATYKTLHDASGTRMSGVPGRVLGTVWLYVLVWFLIMDAAKYVLYYLLQRYTALRHTQDPKRPAGPCRECETQQGSFCSIETADQQQPGWELRSGDTAFPPRPLPTT